MAEYNGASVNIYYVHGENGNDAPGGGTSVLGAWQTIQYAFDRIADGTIVDGDEVRILSTSNDERYYDLGGAQQTGGKLTCTWNNREVIINGANSSGVVDGTIVTIFGDSLDGSTPMMEVSVKSVDYTCFSHLKFDANDTAQHCIAVTDTNNHQVTFVNCQFTSATDHGINMNANANYWSWINCRADNNGGSGIEHSSSNYGLYNKCLFDNNAGDGLRSGGAAMIVECVFFNNGDDGAFVSSYASRVCNCVCDNNTGIGMLVSGGGQSIVTNCIFTNNGEYGISVGAATECRQFNSAFYNNGTDSYYTTGAVHLSMYNYLDDVTTTWGVTADFNFTPNGASSVIGAGLPTPYGFFGSTADDIGLQKWINTETISII